MSDCPECGGKRIVLRQSGDMHGPTALPCLACYDVAEDWDLPRQPVHKSVRYRAVPVSPRWRDRQLTWANGLTLLAGYAVFETVAKIIYTEIRF